MILPTAIAYDLVLEDHILARQAVKRRQRPFSRELAEMVRFAVGYRSRAFVTFGRADSASTATIRLVAAIGARPRASACAAQSGRLYKVLPTALVAAAMRPSITRRDLDRPRSTRCSTRCARSARTWRRRAARPRSTAAAEPFEARGIIVHRGRPVPRARAQRAALLRADRFEHLLLARRPDALMLDAASKALLPLPRAESAFSSGWRRATAWRRTRLRAPVHRRRDRSRKRSPPCGRSPRAACC